MTIQELRDFFTKSDYSDEVKNAIIEVLKDKTETTPGILSNITDLLQKELDADFEELGVDVSNEPEAQAIQKEYDDTLDKIQKDLDNDMEFVEKEMNDLNDVTKQISDLDDQMKADAIKQSI